MTFSSPSASLDLKVPTNTELTQRRERRQRERQNQQNNNFACASRFLYISLPSLHEISISRFRGCLHDTGATFASERVHSVPSHGSIFVYMIPPQISCWRESPGASSPRFLYQGENFTPVRNLATVSCKHETTTRFGVKSVCW